MDPQEVLKHSKITGNSICGISGSGININATDLIVNYILNFQITW